MDVTLTSKYTAKDQYLEIYRSQDGKRPLVNVRKFDSRFAKRLSSGTVSIKSIPDCFRISVKDLVEHLDSLGLLDASKFGEDNNTCCLGTYLGKKCICEYKNNDFGGID